MIFFKIIVVIFLSLVLVFAAVFVYLHQLWLPSLEFDRVERVLVVFPHAVVLVHYLVSYDRVMQLLEDIG